MSRTDVTVRTEDGACAATLHTPSSRGSWPAVILYPDAAGVRETFAAMADRLAGLGYAVLLPDIYYRTGGYTPFDVATVFSDPAEMKRLSSLAASMTAEMIIRDGGAFLGLLGGRSEVSGIGVGTTGYCMGGRISLIVAGGRGHDEVETRVGQMCPLQVPPHPLGHGLGYRHEFVAQHARIGPPIDTRGIGAGVNRYRKHWGPAGEAGSSPCLGPAVPPHPELR